ncbi:hypothetical protein ACIRP7_37725 [Streptomyces sp. NPDC102270]|uniref:hypothetical protein n=1 Tax=Streptomyces sp. NPDC102270 TaxID=3366150 RepID=UPI0037FF5A8D
MGPRAVSVGGGRTTPGDTGEAEPDSHADSEPPSPHTFTRPVRTAASEPLLGHPSPS